MLAGIITEGQYKEMLKEDIQRVTLYATYNNPRAPWKDEWEEEEGWMNHLDPNYSAPFPVDYYKSTGKLIPVEGKGLNMNEGRIGCQFTPFTFGEGAPDSEVYVEFEKPISEVYLDDDLSLYKEGSIVNDIEGFKEWYKGKSEEETGKPVSLADISQFGINTNGVGYGLYVKEINRSEVKSMKSGIEGEDLKPFKI